MMLRLLMMVAVVFVACPSAEAQVEKRDVHIAVGGKTGLLFLPLSIAEQLGYFKEEGLEVKISDFAGGSQALRAVVGGSADVVSGAYEHAIILHAKKQYLQAFVLQGWLPQIVMGISSSRASEFKSFKDLKGMKIGVSAPGSATHNLVKQVLSKGGLDPNSVDPNNSVAIIGVGIGASAIAAIKSGRIDALSNVDPVISKLESDGSIKIIADTRTLKGTIDVWWAALPTSCLYAPVEFVKRYPKTTQALANAIVRANKWIARATADDVMRVVPEAYLGGDRALYAAAFGNVKESYSPDGIVAKEGAEALLEALRRFNSDVEAAPIDLGMTFTNEFAQKASAKYK